MSAIDAITRLRATHRERRRPSLLTLTDTLAALGDNGVAGEVFGEVATSSIVGTVARSGDFDREFRPLRDAGGARWRSVADAMDAGRELPPVQLVRLGEMYFVRDGHHRVSVARAFGRLTLPAKVLWICTIAYGEACLRLAHLPAKAAERAFLQRVPLPDDVRAGLWLPDPADWMRLGDAAEAWAFRQGLGGRALTDRSEFAAAWWREEVVPTLAAEIPCTAGTRDVERYVSLLPGRPRR